MIKTLVNVAAVYVARTPWVARVARMLFVAACSAASGAQAAGLPVPCAGGTCGAGPQVWVTGGAATAVVNGPGTRLDINQTTDRALLNWAEFNIAAGNTVNFNQPGKSAIALNRIFQNDPSKIFGALTANGQVYLINQNGILFGKGSKVNVSSLVASSLDIDEQAIAGGVLDPGLLLNRKPAFAGDGRVFVLDQDGQVVTDAAGEPIPVKVVVEMDATIKSDAAGGGRIALLGQGVENAGTLESPAGQVILAAGQKVYLQASADPELRGLLVEVDAGGKAWNQVTGEIAVPKGNATLVGLAVNQDGRISATTSVRSNGSVRLLARDTVNVTVGAGGAVSLAATNGGSVSLGAGSRVDVSPDATDTETAIDEQKQSPSRVEVTGRQVTLQSGSVIRAAGGEVSIRALQNPSASRPGGSDPLLTDPDSRIRLEAGSLIDVAGSTATTSVARNAVTVELRANELRDSPTQRDGALRGKTVVVDARVGTPLADVTGAIASIKRGIAERTSVGGTVALESQGDVVMAEGAKVDVSGGKVIYTGGVVATSLLVTADGRVIDIGLADPGKIYSGVRNPTTEKVYAKWGIRETVAAAGVGFYDPGYVQGRNAGTVSFAAPGLVINGSLVGNSVNGAYQRDAVQRSLGGRLVVGLADGQGLTIPDFRTPSIHFSPTVVPVFASPDEALPATVTRLDLPTDYLRTGGFTRTELYSNGLISLDADSGLDLAPGSKLTLRGSVIDLAGSIHSSGGEIRATAVTVNPAVSLVPERRPGITVGPGVTVDVSGNWVNDANSSAGATPADPIFRNAGVVDLTVNAQGGELVIGDDVTLRADAGVRLNSTGRQQSGAAGQISLQARGPDAALATGRNLNLSAYGFDKGGSLTLAGNQLRVGGGSGLFADAQRSDPLGPGSAPYVLNQDVFSAGGFSAYRLVATGGRLESGGSRFEPLEVAAGVTLLPRTATRALSPGYASAPTSADLRDFSSVVFLPDYARPATNLAFALEPHKDVTPETAGDIVLGSGSRILADAGARIDISAPTHLRLDGEITAPAGQISARLVNPAQNLDRGFDPDAGIFVGSSARISAAGVAVVRPSDTGLRQGTVLDGGTISLTADRGSVQLAGGSLLDVSGSSADLDILTASGSPSFLRQAIASRGGAISLLASEGLTLGGDLRGASGSASSVRPEGGSLTVGVTRRNGFNPSDDPSLIVTYPTGPRRVIVTTGAAPSEGDANGVVRFNPHLMATGGFDSLTLRADNNASVSAEPADGIVFAQDSVLSVANALRLQAPNIVAEPGVETIRLGANYLSIGPTLTSPAQPGVASGGTANLIADAGLIELVGGVALQGVGTSRLTSRSDLRLVGLPGSPGEGLRGSFAAAGQVTLTAAQLYPTTYSLFNLSVAPDDGGLLEISGGGSGRGPLLAGAGQINVSAATIQQDGVIRAPLGRITLTATDSLRLGADSLTSTSAERATIPFGRVVAGSEWSYEPTTGIFETIATPPAAQVNLKSNSVVIAATAAVDISGGGDLYAYEFVPGPGGSADALSTAQNPNLFALLPGLATGFAPYDTQEYQGSSLRPGDSVYLDGLNGILPAGVYALLPARYALLPDAVLVQAVAGTTDLTASSRASLPDGTPVVAGYRTIGGTTLRDSRTTGFAIRPGSYARQLAEYRDSFANTFFADQAARADLPALVLPRDAGTFRLQVGEMLDLGGIFRTSAGPGGQGAAVDLSANQLRIVQTAGVAAPGVVEVTADRLAGLGAASLLIGGTRARTTDGATEITAAASTVAIAGGTAVAGPEVLLVARDEVRLEENSSLSSTGATAGTAPRGQLLFAGDGAGALVRVSRNGQADVARPAGSSPSGDVFIGAGVRLDSPGSITVAAGGTARSFGRFEVGSGLLSLASSRIVLGADQAEVIDGLALGNADLAGFSGAGELQLSAAARVDFSGVVALGVPGSRPARLVIDTPELQGAGSDASFTAGTIVLRNSGAAALAPGAGVGLLSLVSDRILFDTGSVVVAGFDQAFLAGTGGLRTAGDFSLVSAADLTLTAPALTGAPGSSLVLRAPGRALALRHSSGSASETAGIGAAVDAEAGNVFVDTSLAFPAGRVRLAADSDLQLGGTASVDVRGIRQSIDRVATVLPAGDVSLLARNGSLHLDSGSRVDVSAGDPAGSAGELSIYTGGLAALDGVLAGTAEQNLVGGSFRLYAGELAEFSVLNASLNAGGFGRSREIELATGNLVIASDSTVRANRVHLAASGGSMTLAGAIDASDTNGGSVVLAARDDLTIAAGGVISAIDTSSRGGGGSVSLLSGEGQLQVQPGAAIRTSGSAGENSGSLLLRAQAAGFDLNIGELALDALSGVGQLILEPVTRVVSGAAVAAPAIAGWRQQLTDYMVAAPAAIRSRLGLDGSRDVIRPGLEVTTPGNLNVGTDWNLADWRFDGQPGYLTIRAPGDLSLAGEISDGFVKGGTVAAPTLTQVDGPGWTYRLVAGAAGASALPWATSGRQIDSGGTGSISLANNKIVRTGTGSILLAADGDISLAGSGSLIYTAGVPAKASAQTTTVPRATRYWVRDGGDIVLQAGRDVLAAAPVQAMSGWNVRNIDSAGRAEWSIDITKFKQGIAAMAGGDVHVAAGRDISNLSASVLTTSGERATDPGVSDVWGGGDISVEAGRDVLGGIFSTWMGNGELTAGNSIASGRIGSADVFPILSFGLGSFSATARKDLTLEGVINPTTVAPANGGSVYFYTYAPTDSLNLLATGGNLTLANNPRGFTAIAGVAVAGSTPTFGVYPASVKAYAPSGDIQFLGGMSLLPGPAGQLDLVAGGSLRAPTAGTSLVMSDADPASVPVAASPTGKDAIRVPIQRSTRDVIHAGDSEPVNLIAAAGSISGGTYSLAKSFYASAGRDIRNVAIGGQNTAPAQLSLVRAGRDIVLPDQSNGFELAGPGRLAVLAGRNVDLGFSRGITTLGRSANSSLPGPDGAAIDLWAGLGAQPAYTAFSALYWGERYDADLGRFATGNGQTPGLIAYVAQATGQQDLTVDSVWSAYGSLDGIQKQAYLDSLTPADRITFSSFTTLVDRVVDYTRSITGDNSLTASSANDAYLNLNAGQQRPLLEEMFFRELRDSGREANLPGDLAFTRGKAAVAALFPGDTGFAGDLSLVFSRIYTLDGGDINLLVPGGSLNVGLSTLPRNLGFTKKPAELGIVAQGTGAVRVFAKSDVLVNQSRIFTLQGGDIVIWSSTGDIDAGRGSKTAISAPPPTITVSPTGEVAVEFSDAIAGSGIRGILTSDSIVPGDVDLIAPTGQVNAGDAGIGSAGNLNIAAPVVVGLDNIQVGGVSTGVPTESGISASLAGAGNAAAGATRAAEDTTSECSDANRDGVCDNGADSLADAALGWLDVFVDGFGDGEARKR